MNAADPESDRAFYWSAKSRLLKRSLSWFRLAIKIKKKPKNQYYYIYHPSCYTFFFCHFIFLLGMTLPSPAVSLSTSFWVIRNILGGTRGLYISIKIENPTYIAKQDRTVSFLGTLEIVHSLLSPHCNNMWKNFLHKSKHEGRV